MRWKLFALCIVATACAAGETVAQEPTNAPMFQQWVVNRTKFTFVGGRVFGANGNWMFGIPGQVSVDGPIRERVNFNGNGITGSITYSYQYGGGKADPRVEFGLEMSSDGRFALRYSDKERPDSFFKLTQVPGQPISLALPPADKPRVLKAPSIWHLLIVNAEDCRKELLPMLEAIHPGWHVGLAAQSAEDEMVKMAAVSRKSDRKQWETWIDQLGDPIFMHRDRADRNLRDVGPAVLGYLNRLDMNRLDAEQKSRVRGIIRFLSTQAGEDTPEHVASMLIEDPLVWLALLARPDEATRTAAVQQLTVLLNVPITIDPKAEPDSQAKAREELRTQIEKTEGEASKPGDDSKPAGENGKPSSPAPSR